MKKILCIGFNDQKLYELLSKEQYMGVCTFDARVEMIERERPFEIIVDLENVGDWFWEVWPGVKEDSVIRKAALILLSSSNDEDVRVKGLEIGADDFVAKPFSPRELVARIKAIARRLLTPGEVKKIQVKDLEIDLDEHRVRKAGKSIDLTYIQFKLLYLLASRRNKVFSRKEILEMVWGKKVYVTDRTVDVHIKRLRKKLGEYKGSQYIETIHSTGYRFAVGSQEASRPPSPPL